MQNITKEQWDQVTSSEKPVFVDFWATWCGSCNVMTPIVEELAKEYEGKADFVKVNVDQNKELAKKYNIISIPAFVIFQNGKVIAQHSGVASKESVSGYIHNNIKEGLKA